MMPANLDEYREVRVHTIEIQQCITEYMRSFYGVGAALVTLLIALIGVWSRLQLLSVDKVLGASALFLSIIVLAFASIMFHKFQSHNRYAGYARVLSVEHWNTSWWKAAPDQIFLWEWCIGSMHVPPPPRENPQDASADENEIRRYLETCRMESELSLKNIARNGGIGLWMLFRAPFAKRHTESWSYPNYISFGLFAVAVGLFVAWVFTFVASVGVAGANAARADALSPSFAVILLEFAVATYVVASWIGMCVRLYRVCDKNGDRTIKYFAYRFALERARALSRFGIDYDFAGVRH